MRNYCVQVEHKYPERWTQCCERIKKVNRRSRRAGPWGMERISTTERECALARQ
jgi:hypothetical protein